MNNSLNLLGLCRRAGKLCMGDDLCTDTVKQGRARLIVLSNNAGEYIYKKFKRLSGAHNIPCMVLTLKSDEVGSAIGRRDCSVCVITDLGFAIKVASTLTIPSKSKDEIIETLTNKQNRAIKRKDKEYIQKKQERKKNLPKIKQEVQFIPRNTTKFELFLQKQRVEKAKKPKKNRSNH